MIEKQLFESSNYICTCKVKVWIWLSLSVKSLACFDFQRPNRRFKKLLYYFYQLYGNDLFFPAVLLKTADRCNLKTVYWKKAEINMSADLPFDFAVTTILLFIDMYSQSTLFKQEWYLYSSKDMFSLWHVCWCLLDCDLQVASEDWISHVYKSSLHE